MEKCPKGSKSTLRAHLTEVFEQTGIMPEELAIGEPPRAVAYLLGYFDELCMGRSSGMSLNPISYSDIAAWSALTKTALRVWEVKALKRLDLIYLNVQLED